MTDSTQNIIYKWSLRAKYIFIFIAGAGLLSFGFDTLIEPGKFSKREELNNFIIIMCLFFGLALIIVGFYRKNQIEYYIQQQKL
ncbi:hypothetical protein [Olleya sp. UBA1516]|uniref:hypothetical protein n=1 Tax=Olleya sp. UBA1516 TaxID=1947013 RepID=UPI0025DEFD9E|nr:hypothetical protein [Olleya sp. UBA1516]|tara:strand:+ start:5756 stop:6007 length:252 start_codon:yes stop_codon:yes gene_type:complete